MLSKLWSFFKRKRVDAQHPQERKDPNQEILELKLAVCDLQKELVHERNNNKNIAKRFRTLYQDIQKYKVEILTLKQELDDKTEVIKQQRCEESLNSDIQKSLVRRSQELSQIRNKNQFLIQENATLKAQVQFYEPAFNQVRRHLETRAGLSRLTRECDKEESRLLGIMRTLDNPIPGDNKPTQRLSPVAEEQVWKYR